MVRGQGWEMGEEVLYAAVRVVAAFVYLQHGAQKLFGVLGGFGGHPGGTAPLGSLMGLAGVIEFFGGLLILVGLATRVVAFIASGEMAVAYFMAHAPHGFFWTLVNHGELPALFAFLFLFFAVRGGGRYSLDAVLRRGAWRGARGLGTTTGGRATPTTVRPDEGAAG